MQHGFPLDLELGTWKKRDSKAAHPRLEQLSKSNYHNAFVMTGYSLFADVLTKKYRYAIVAAMAITKGTSHEVQPLQQTKYNLFTKHFHDMSAIYHETHRWFTTLAMQLRVTKNIKITTYTLLLELICMNGFNITATKMDRSDFHAYYWVAKRLSMLQNSENCTFPKSRAEIVNTFWATHTKSGYTKAGKLL